MSRHYLLSIGLTLVVLALVGGTAALLYNDVPRFAAGTSVVAAEVPTKPVPGAAVFDPPAPEEAPQDILDGVMLGYRILMDTHRYAGQYVGNELDCRNCHFEAGRLRETLSLVGVSAKYPKFRTREGYVTDLVTRTNGCFQRSCNGKPLPADSREMQAIMAYYHWISKGIPMYADIPWLGLEPVPGSHQPDAANGRAVFSSTCTQCHGPEGQGTATAPPLWGPGSYNDGAGMSHPDTLAAFAWRYMPRGNPVLEPAQAVDVAAFVDSRPRPRFGGGQ